MQELPNGCYQSSIFASWAFKKTQVRDGCFLKAQLKGTQELDLHKPEITEFSYI